MCKTCFKMEELSIEITYKCPFSCVMCSSSASLDKDMPVIPLNKIKEMIDDSKKNCGTVYVSLSGGEPAFHPDFVEIVEYIHESGLTPIIYTIGVDWDHENKKAIPYRDEYIELFKRTNSKVILPIHGIEETHNGIVCTENAFNLEIQTIKKLLDEDIEVQIHFVPQIWNYRELLDVYFLCCDIGVKKMSLLRFVPQGRGVGQEDFNELQLGITMGMIYTIRKMRNHILEKERYSENINSISTHFRIGIPMDFTFQIDDTKKEKACDGGKSKVLVRATGQVNVCPAWKGLEEYDAGNIYQRSISDIWENANTYKMFRDLKPEDLKGQCHKCNHLPDCMGGCAAQRILFNKDIKIGPDPYCMKNRI